MLQSNLRRRVFSFNHSLSRNMSSTMKAVVIRGKEAKLERDRPLPRLRDDYILVKTEAVALNPTDWKHVAFGIGAEGGLVGCDFAGTVVEVGKDVTKKWNKGDRIAGVAHGGNKAEPQDGAFSEYIVAKGMYCTALDWVATDQSLWKLTCPRRCADQDPG